MNSAELIQALRNAISDVMTDAQLDTPVRANGGATTRDLMIKASLLKMGIADEVKTKDSANKGGHIKAYWHPHGYRSATKRNADWQPLVLEE